MTNHIAHQRIPMPGRLKGALAILCLQILANGVIGFLVLEAVSDSHGARVSNEGLIYFLGYLSIAVAAILLVCAVLTPSRFAWIRPTVIAIEAIGIIGGAINLFSGQLTAFIGIALAIWIISILNREDVKDFYDR